MSSVIFYALILVFAMIHLFIAKRRMWMGLRAEFLLAQESETLKVLDSDVTIKRIFENDTKAYVLLIVFVVVGVLITLFSAFQVLLKFNALDIYSGVILVLFSIYFLIEEIHYNTAYFVVWRMRVLSK